MKTKNEKAKLAFELTDPEMETILGALEAYAYWQVSEEKYRSNGYVYGPGADDPEIVEHLKIIDRLAVKFGGEPITCNSIEEVEGVDAEHVPWPITFDTSPPDKAVAEKMLGFPKECEQGEHDFDIKDGYKLCNRCTAHVPFPNTRDGLLNFLQAETERMLTIARAKNQDYAGDVADPFANFTRVKALGICTPEVGFLTRMSDKLSRIASITASGKTAVKDESVGDTLRDLANYSLLMLAYLESKKEGD